MVKVLKGLFAVQVIVMMTVFVAYSQEAGTGRCQELFALVGKLPMVPGLTAIAVLVAAAGRFPQHCHAGQQLT